MRDVSLAEAKAQLSHLIAEAEAGKAVRILRRGQPIARIVGIEPTRKPIDLARLQAVTATMVEAPEAREPFVRQMRDEDRY